MHRVYLKVWALKAVCILNETDIAETRCLFRYEGAGIEQPKEGAELIRLVK